MKTDPLPASVSIGQYFQNLAQDLGSAAKRVPETTVYPFVIGESVTKLRRGDERSRARVQGKLENLRQICRRLNGVIVPSGEPFSLWRHLGPPLVLRGFMREGRAAALEQITWALGEAASDGGFKSETPKKKLRWPQRDFTINAREDLFVIEARMTPEELVVRFRGVSPSHKLPLFNTRRELPRHRAPLAADSHFKTAALLDRYVPEFEAYLSGELIDLYLIPARHWTGGQRYSWFIPSSSSVRTTWLTMAARSFYTWWTKRKRIPAETRLRTTEWIAKAFASRLPFDVEHLIIAQDFLPFLWRMGILQGRSFDVLLTRPALNTIHERLDLAREMMPEASALDEFRADPRLVEAESEALVYAERVVTPHEDFAQLYPNLRKLEWEEPEVVPPADVRRPQYLLLPASLRTREGARSVLQVARELDFPLLVVGEDPEGLATENKQVSFIDEASIPWNEVAAVVHPSLFESWPRIHLQAVALDIPVVATEFVGLEESKLVTHVPFGRDDEFRKALERALSREGDPMLDSHLEAVHAAEEKLEAQERVAASPVPLSNAELQLARTPRELNK